MRISKRLTYGEPVGNGKRMSRVKILNILAFWIMLADTIRLEHLFDVFFNDFELL